MRGFKNGNFGTSSEEGVALRDSGISRDNGRSAWSDATVDSAFHTVFLFNGGGESIVDLESTDRPGVEKEDAWLTMVEC